MGNGNEKKLREADHKDVRNPIDLQYVEHSRYRELQKNPVVQEYLALHKEFGYWGSLKEHASHVALIMVTIFLGVWLVWTVLAVFGIFLF